MAMKENKTNYNTLAQSFIAETNGANFTTASWGNSGRFFYGLQLEPTPIKRRPKNSVGSVCPLDIQRQLIPAMQVALKEHTDTQPIKHLCVAQRALRLCNFTGQCV